MAVVDCEGMVCVFVESSPYLYGDYAMIVGQFGSRVGMFVLQFSLVW